MKDGPAKTTCRKVCEAIAAGAVLFYAATDCAEQLVCPSLAVRAQTPATRAATAEPASAQIPGTLHFPYVSLGPNLRPHLLGRIGGERISGVGLDDGYAYLVMDANETERARLRIVDVADPTRPQVLGETAVLPAGGGNLEDSFYFYTADVVVDSGVVFVVRPPILDGRGVLYAIDIAELDQPRLLGWVPVGGQSVAVGNGLAFVGGPSRRLEVIDIGNPAYLTHLASFEGFGGDSVELIGHHLIATCRGCETMQVIDVSAPTRPRLVNEVRAISSTAATPMVELAVAEGVAYVVSDIGDLGPSSVRAFDVSDPARPNPVGELVGGESGIGEILLDAAAGGHRLYATETEAGLHVFDVSLPSRPRTLGRTPLAGYGTSIDVSHAGQRLYVADIVYGLSIYQREPEELSLVGRYPVATAVNFAAVDGSVAYLAADSGLWVVDISKPHEALKRGYVDLGRPARWVGIEGDIAYLAMAGDDWVAVDVSTPHRPRALSSLDRRYDASYWYTPRRLGEVMDQAILVRDRSRNVRVIDASDPADLKQASLLELGARDIAIVDGRALALTGGAIIELDVSDPYNVEARTLATLEDWLYAPYALADGFLIGMNADDDLMAYDVVDLESPKRLWTGDVEGYPSSLSITGELLCAIFGNELKVFALSGAAPPRELGVAELGYDALLLDGEKHIYVVQRGDGLQVFDPGF